MSSDVKLIKELKQNSAKAFKQVYHQYYKLVYFNAYSILNNSEDAEDVMQNTFIKLMKNIEAINDDSNLKQLLSKMSKNEAIDLYRKKVNRKEVYDESLMNSLKSNDNKNDFDLIITLNNLLEKSEAEIVVKKIVYDYSFKEIALEANNSIGIIQAKYYKALEKLKSYYKGELLK